MLHCPSCGESKFEVIKTRRDRYAGRIDRQRLCNTCGAVFWTAEKVCTNQPIRKTTTTEGKR